MHSVKRGNVLPIAIMFALFFMIAFVTGLQTPLADVVKGQFSGNNALSMLGNLDASSDKKLF